MVGVSPHICSSTIFAQRRPVIGGITRSLLRCAGLAFFLQRHESGPLRVRIGTIRRPARHFFFVVTLTLHHVGIVCSCSCVRLNLNSLAEFTERTELASTQAVLSNCRSYQYAILCRSTNTFLT